MSYLIIDDFGTFPLLSMNEDGETLEFETYKEAKEYAEKYLQPEFYEIIEREGIQ